MRRINDWSPTSTACQKSFMQAKRACGIAADSIPTAIMRSMYERYGNGRKDWKNNALRREVGMGTGSFPVISLTAAPFPRTARQLLFQFYDPGERSGQSTMQLWISEHTSGCQ